MAPYEFFEHTADMGLRVRADTLPLLFEHAARGLLDLIVEDLEALRPTDEAEVRLTAPDDADLLVDWLNDRLYHFDAREEIHAWPTLALVGGGRLEGRSGFIRIDRDRHRFHGEVKSTTYHGLVLERRGDFWIAEVIFDL